MSAHTPSTIRLRLLGTVPYEEALTRMREWTAARHDAHKAKLVARRLGGEPSSPQPGQDDPAMSPTGTDTAQIGDSPPLPAAPSASSPVVADSGTRHPTRSDGDSTANGTTSLLEQTPAAVLRDWADPADAPSLGDEIWLLQHPPVFTLGLNARTEHLHDAGDIPVVPTERGGQITYHGPGQIMAYLMLDLRSRKLGIRPLVERVEEAIIQCLAGYGITAIRQDGAPGIYVRQAKAPPHVAIQAAAKPPTGTVSSLEAVGIDSPSPLGPPSAPSQQAASTQQQGQVPMAQPTGTANTSPVSPTDIPSPTSRRLATTRPDDDVAKIASIGLKATHGFSYHGLALNGQMDLSPFLRINPCGYQHLAMTDVFHETGQRADIDLDALALNLGRALQAAIEGTEG